MALTDLDTWSRAFTDFTTSLAHRVPRIEPRRQATSCLRGLRSELKRKNG
ncbi:hypothetical protein HNR10_001320 [Nocardiopsis aegyptia]|uniref:Uncharacterized protein n=1 Tax=Nocardiopsis aegyptia TaxID=220378 RepID=A0A7Z0J9F4_9ACTN|nr:hypothetical protein [Nocardiopsis aegyptia]